MVSIWKAPVLAYRGVFKLWLKNLCIWHIIYLTGQPEDRLSLSVPANYNAMWAAYSLPESRAAYLFFKFRIATIKRPIVSITINSSYVLMSTTPFRRTRNEMAARPPDCPGKHIILSWCSNCPVAFLAVHIRPKWLFVVFLLVNAKNGCMWRIELLYQASVFRTDTKPKVAWLVLGWFVWFGIRGDLGLLWYTFYGY